MIVSSSAMAANIAGVATKLKAELPPAYVAAVQAARSLRGNSDFTGATAKLNAAAITALREGREPGADPLVQALAAEVTLAAAGLGAAVEQWVSDHVTERINEHADAILTTFAEAVRPDLEVLERAAPQLDQADLNNPDTVALRRAGLLDVWALASASAERGDLAISGLRYILRAVHVGFDGPAGNALLIAPDADVSTITAIGARSGRGTLSAWTAARCGAPLRLPTVTEYQRAVARFTAARQERERQADAEAEQRPKPKQQQQWTKIR